jgi:hypothetical protein
MHPMFYKNPEKVQQKIKVEEGTDNVKFNNKPRILISSFKLCKNKKKQDCKTKNSKLGILWL